MKKRRSSSGSPEAASSPYQEGAGLFDNQAWKQHSWLTDTVLGVRDLIPKSETPLLDAAQAPEDDFVSKDGDQNQTSRYHELVDLAEKGENTLPPDAQNYVYLNVPGLITEHYVGYMDQNLARQAELGLDARIAAIDTDASVEANAKVLRDQILKIAKEEGKQVVLTGHSKGGVDIGAALQLYPELEEHVRAVVTMQSPYRGTEIANDVSEAPILGNLTASILEDVWKGDRRALSDLKRETRADFNEKNPYNSDIPTVSLVTETGDAPSALAPAAAYLDHRYNEKSDGLVPTDSAVLPGADYVHLSGIDHAAPTNLGLGGTTPGATQQALLTLALEKANRQDAKK